MKRIIKRAVVYIGMNAFKDLLQDRERFIKDIADSIDLRKKLNQLMAISGASFLLYGLIIGSSQHSLLQALSSGIKLPILFLLTIAICMPTLYIFGSFFGSRRSALQTFVLLFAGTAIMGIALVGLAPVTFFFIVTTDDYQFFKLMNVAFFSIAGALGVGFLSRYMQLPHEHEEIGSTRSLLLRFWFILYAFVGTQLAWTLRPFFGAPGLRFEVVRDFGGNFYENVFAAIGHVLGAR